MNKVMKYQDYLEQIDRFEDTIDYGHYLLEQEDNPLGASINRDFAIEAYRKLEKSGRKIDNEFLTREICCLDKKIRDVNGGRSDFFSFMGL